MEKHQPSVTRCPLLGAVIPDIQNDKIPRVRFQSTKMSRSFVSSHLSRLKDSGFEKQRKFFTKMKWSYCSGISWCTAAMKIVKFKSSLGLWIGTTDHRSGILWECFDFLLLQSSFSIHPHLSLERGTLLSNQLAGLKLPVSSVIIFHQKICRH